MNDLTLIENPVVGDWLRNLPVVSNSSEVFFARFLPNLVGLSIVIGVLGFFGIMLVGAIQWISSSGDKAALESARGKIVNALIGIILLFATFAIIKLIEDFFGVDILTLDIGPLKIE